MDKITNKPKKGQWDNLPTEDTEKKPKIIFEVNIPKKLVFIGEPREFPSREDPESVFYVFNVQEDKVDKSISTSSWTLLHGLKKLSPLNGKVIEITKRLRLGKQYFEVIEVK